MISSPGKYSQNIDPAQGLRHDSRPVEPKKKVNLRLLELQIAKKILAEIFHVEPVDIER